MDWPAGFESAAPREALLSTWDAFVEELWADAPRHGAVLLAARFPRACIDTNRADDDLDPALLSEPWPGPLATTDYSRRGMGLIRRLALPNVPMYRRPLTVAEVQRRIDLLYRPYRAALRARLDALHGHHGEVWHLNLHSMKSRGNAMNVDAGAKRPDIVVSDRDGTTAAAVFTIWVASWFTTHGFLTRINTPYRGGDLIVTHGHPARGRHSIQIEVNRALYMDEANFTRGPGFTALRETFDAFVADLARHLPHLATASARHPS